ncbi:MAG TPA: DJ-1/PfpI family protein [Woeseiaceae bacterium]|nr:DJ-1/PfpI family protein [Woeseiaceae bacterium]
MKKRSVAIVIYEGVEVLDFAGPFEVFSVTDELNDYRHFDVSLIAASDTPYATVNNMRVLPNRVFEDAESPSILVVPGGAGSKAAMKDKPLLDWVGTSAAAAEIVLSVCSGARVLAQLGLLDNLEVTTHHQVATHLQSLAPAAKVAIDRRFIDTGKVVTTGGITAGIDGAFHIVARLLGEMTAKRTAQYMEYDWRPQQRYSTKTDNPL